MTDTEFEALSDAALASIERSLEASGVEADIEQKGTGLLEIEFENGSKMILNRQAAVREVWIAARSGGFHYRYDGQVWRDTRDGSELFAALSKLVSAQSGTPVILAPA